MFLVAFPLADLVDQLQFGSGAFDTSWSGRALALLHASVPVAWIAWVPICALACGVTIFLAGTVTAALIHRQNQRSRC